MQAPSEPGIGVDEDVFSSQESHESVMLAIGDVVAGRFHVIAVETLPDGALEYVVEDRGVCRSCGVEVQPSEEEPYCFECGAHLLDAETPWPRRRLRPITDAATAAQVVWGGQRFDLLEEAGSALNATLQKSPLTFTHGVTLLAGQRSDVGVARADRPDEDSIFALTMTSIYESQARPTLGLYMVADGMGGHGDGEVASRITVDVASAGLIQSLLLPLLQGNTLPDETIRLLIDAALQSANRRVIENARVRGNDMGSTVTMAFIVDTEVYVANVGDSRTYLWRGGMLTQLTEDHSAVFQLVRQGLLAEEEIYTHPRRNEIVRSIGFGQRLQVDLFRHQFLPGDMLLLCCDGLWEMLHNDGIADVLLAAYGDPQAVCDELIKRANLAGGDDNISVIVVRAGV
jgi:serine/threonine protein phosphatase PrpC